MDSVPTASSNPQLFKNFSVVLKSTMYIPPLFLIVNKEAPDTNNRYQALRRISPYTTLIKWWEFDYADFLGPLARTVRALA